MADKPIVLYDIAVNRLTAPSVGSGHRGVTNVPILVLGTIESTGLVNGRNMPDDGTKLDLVTVTGATDLDAIRSKASNITITQPVDLDAIEARVNQLDASVVLMGTWDASTLTYPASTKAGESWICSVAGMVGAIQYNVNDRVVALVDNANPGIPNNWHKLDYTDEVLSVAGRVGAVELTEADITDLQAYLLATDIDTLSKLNALVGESLLTAELLVPVLVNTAISYAVLPVDKTVNVTANDVDLTVYTAVGYQGYTLNLKNSGSGVVTILTTAAETIDGAASGEIVLDQYENLTIQSDGTNWIIL